MSRDHLLLIEQFISMKAVLVLFALIGVIYARPQILKTILGSREVGIGPYIVRYDSNNAGFGGFRFSFDTSNQIHQDEVGAIADPGTPDEGQAVYGHYSYIGDNGKNYSVEYFADKDGFRAAGEHLPPAANLTKVGPLGIPSGALASLAGGGLG